MVYMLAVPARLAGVPRVVMVTPPEKDGSVNPACLYAARRCGVHEVYRVGGAQAIAALAYGTESVAPVSMITGPGSAYGDYGIAARGAHGPHSPPYRPLCVVAG